MRAVVQRVLSSHVDVDGKTVGRIDQGLTVLLGVGQGDSETICKYMADRVARLRIFADSEGKMNLSALELQLPILVISQFTLYAEVHRGRRPGFTGAASPDIARILYEQFCNELLAAGLKVEKGIFQADMKVHIINDGPVTILIDSSDKFGEPSPSLPTP